jgi:acetyltransferase-like isoleucine patch superfamily enzyme
MSLLATLRPYAQENGWFLTAQKAFGGLYRRLRDGLIARELRTQGLSLGRNPRIAGIRHIVLGANFSAADALWIDAITEFAGHRYTPHLVIESNCNVSSYVHIACTNRITIGEGFLCGSNVIISDHAHGQYQGANQTGPEIRPTSRRLSSDGVVTIGNNVWLGDGVAILAGAHIGDGAIIGANSVVNGIIPPNTIAAGAPARVVRRWNGTEWARETP